MLPCVNSVTRCVINLKCDSGEGGLCNDLSLAGRGEMRIEERARKKERSVGRVLTPSAARAETRSFLFRRCSAQAPIARRSCPLPRQ